VSRWLAFARSDDPHDRVAARFAEGKSVAKLHKEPLVDAAIKRLITVGWELREQGHRYYLLCPCGDPRGRIRVDGTPKNPGNHAKRMLREASHCPNEHALDGNLPPGLVELSVSS